MPRASPLDLMALMVEAERLNQRWMQFVNNSIAHWESEHGDHKREIAEGANMFYLTNEHVIMVGWEYVSFCREGRNQTTHEQVK